MLSAAKNFTLMVLLLSQSLSAQDFSKLDEMEEKFTKVDALRWKVLEASEKALQTFLEPYRSVKLPQRVLDRVLLFSSHTFFKEETMSYKWGKLVVAHYMRQQNEFHERIEKLLPPGDALEMRRQLDLALKELKEGNG